MMKVAFFPRDQGLLHSGFNYVNFSGSWHLCLNAVLCVLTVLECGICLEPNNGKISLVLCTRLETLEYTCTYMYIVKLVMKGLFTIELHECK